MEPNFKITESRNRENTVAYGALYTLTETSFSEENFELRSNMCSTS